MMPKNTQLGTGIFHKRKSIPTKVLTTETQNVQCTIGINDASLTWWFWNWKSIPLKQDANKMNKCLFLLIFNEVPKTIFIIIVGSDIAVFAQMLKAEWHNCLNDGSLSLELMSHNMHSGKSNIGCNHCRSSHFFSIPDHRNSFIKSHKYTVITLWWSFSMPSESELSETQRQNDCTDH